MTESHRAKAPRKPAANNAGATFAEFLNPNSMITPGAAGAFTMVITNTLCQQFPLLQQSYTGLGVSLMFGAMVFGYGAGIFARLVYFIINSLIIFVVAAGSNSVAVRQDEANPKTASLEITRPADDKGFNLAGEDKEEAKKPPPKPKFFRPWF
jgi:large-conductance mechanosensitive channel